MNKKLITFVALATVLVATLYLTNDSTTLIKSHQASTGGRWMPTDTACNDACAKVGVVCGVQYNVCCQKDGNCADHSIKIPFVGEKHWKTCGTAVPDFVC